MIKNYEIVIDESSVGQRLDVVLTNKIEELSRSFLKNHSNSILLNDKQIKLSYKCKLNDKIKLKIDFQDTDLNNVVPEEIPLDIIFEDENYIVINKKNNMVVHPAKGNYTGTLVNALLGMNKQLADNDEKYRLGIVHRLDKETSGLIIVAKNIFSHQYLSELLKERRIIKKYHAIVKGFFVGTNIKIENNIGRNPKNRKKMAVLKEGGKKSITYIEKTTHFDNYSYLDIRLFTGRTHQIRVHLSNLGYPIVGDIIYSRKDKMYNDIPLCLVAYYLSFFDKFSNK
jgi:23S rRNA pseudouridine1911/1915/1917 synthase